MHGLGDKKNTLYSMPVPLVDDEENVLMTFKIVLMDKGYSDLKTFSNERDVLRHLFSQKNVFTIKLP